jgi:hypothetical protein
MKLIARGRLRDLVEKGVRIMMHHVSHRRAMRQLSREQGCRHSQAGAGDLHVNAGGRPVIAQKQRQTDHSLVPDRSDLGGVAVDHGVHQRADTGFNKPDKLDAFVGLVKGSSVLQRNRFKMGTQPLVICRRQQSEQTVGYFWYGVHLSVPFDRGEIGSALFCRRRFSNERTEPGTTGGGSVRRRRCEPRFPATRRILDKSCPREPYAGYQT